MKLPARRTGARQTQGWIAWAVVAGLALALLVLVRALFLLMLLD